MTVSLLQKIHARLQTAVSTTKTSSPDSFLSRRMKVIGGNAIDIRVNWSGTVTGTGSHNGIVQVYVDGAVVAGAGSVASADAAVNASVGGSLSCRKSDLAAGWHQVDVKLMTVSGGTFAIDGTTNTNALALEITEISGTGFDPTHLPNLVGWYSARNVATDGTPGNALARVMADKSENGKSATNTVGTGPALISSGINSLPVLRFTAAGAQTLTIGGNGIAFGVESTKVYMVCSLGTMTGTKNFLVHTPGSSEADLDCQLSGSGLNNKPSAAVGTHLATSATAATGAHILTFSQEVTAHAMHVRVDNGSFVDTTTDVPAGTSKYTIIGDAATAPVVDVAEILIFSHATLADPMTATDDAVLLAYLNGLYAIY